MEGFAWEGDDSFDADRVRVTLRDLDSHDQGRSQGRAIPATEREAAMLSLLRKFANHRSSCGCFICRHLTQAERDILAGLVRFGIRAM